MSRMLRSSSPTPSAGITSVPTNDSSQKSIDSCNLCSKLFPANYHFSKKFSSIQMKTDHARIHSDQSNRYSIIYQDYDTLNKYQEKFMSKFFGPSIIQTNIARNKRIGSDDIVIENGLERIRAMTNKEGDIQCRICKKYGIPFIDKNSNKLKVEQVFLHSVTHLPDTALYSCNVCEYSTNSLINGMYEHYSTEHFDIKPSDVKSKYFTTNYLMNKLAIIEMIKKCFDFEFTNHEREFAEFENTHGSATEIRLILLRKQLANGKFAECHKCAKSIDVQLYGRWKKSIAREHAQIHLTNKPILRCSICDTTKPNYCAMRHHFQNNHSDLAMKGMKNHYVDESAKFDQEIDEMLYECFRSITDNHDQPKPDRLNRYKLELQKKISSLKRIRCAICSKSISLKNEKCSFYSATTLSHASTHLPSNLHVYTCNLCNESVCSSSAMSKHFQKIHSDIEVSDRHRYYKNNTNQYETEIVAILNRCFDYQNTTDSASKLIGIRDTSIIKVLQKRRKGPIGLVCYELIKNSSNEFNRLECNVCSNEIMITRGDGGYITAGNSIIEHAMLHAKLPVFVCKICDFGTANRSKMKRHFYQEHNQLKPKYADYFFDNRKKFEKEIIIELKKCFQKM